VKVVLSRKGFDSAAGGVASPILPDGTLLSLPIPALQSPIRYGDLQPFGHDLGGIVRDLTKGHLHARSHAHLDPDLNVSSMTRQRGWRPLFGQCDNEQTVLDREGVGPGDLFLFFGWFREVHRVDGSLCFRRGAPDLHVLWGWLQIDSCWRLPRQVPQWATYHPHLDPTPRRKNVIYKGTSALRLPDRRSRAAGAGVFRHFAEALRLTAPGCTRSVWSLPSWFLPHGGRALGYHGDPDRWSHDGDRCLLRSVGRGQEFVLDTDDYPEALAWAHDLILSHGTGHRSPRALR